MKDITVAREIKSNFNKENKTKKVFAVMLFDTEMNLGIPGAKPNTWINYHNRYFTNGTEALDYYANTPCPASQIIDAKNTEELENKMDEMIENYQNNEWLEKELYPYL